MASARDGPSDARQEARERAARGTEATKEAASEYNLAAQKEGLAAMKGVEDRYESAKEYAGQKSGEVAQSAKETKDSAVDSTVRAKDSVADTASQYAKAAKERLVGLKDSALHSFYQTKDSGQESAENVKETAVDKTSATEAAMRKATDNVGVTGDRASYARDVDAGEPVYTSETRRATAGQVADYAAK